MEFNDEQKKAITSDAKYILCLAGAGSGKTAVLTNRIAELTKQRISPNYMLALTFTRLAGKEMKERIINLIGETEGNKLFCNTFHSFCVKVLKEYGYKIGHEKEFSIWDEDDKISVIQSIMKDLFLEKVKVDQVKECIENDYKKEEYPGLVDAILIANEYKYRLRRNSAVDLDMLLKDTLKLLTMYPEVQQYYHQQYKYVFVDEFQDTNKVQMDIIKALDPINLFSVGDDFQSIYGWRGAVPEYIINFQDIYPECEVIKLEQNYRSTKQIVAAANSVISYNENQTKKVLRTDKQGCPIEYMIAEDAESEAQMIACKILEYENDKFKDFAVLSRTNKQLEIFCDAFKKFEIPYQLVNNKEDVFKKQHIKKIINLIDVAVNSKDDIALKSIINFPENRLTADQLNKVEARIIQKNLSLLEGLITLKFKPETEPKIKKLLSIIAEIKSFLQVTDSPIDIFDHTVKTLELDNIYCSEGRVSRLDDIDKVREKISRWYDIQKELSENSTISQFLKYIRIRDIQEKLAEEKNAVKLMTIHASKGLQYKNVFVVGMNQDVFPNKRSDIEEERRLFYVSITRAESRLFITRSKFKELPYIKKKIETVESQFIKEMGIA